MNRVDRLVAIILLLQSRRIIRACDIAEHFDISVRTVYRDLNALGEAGVPIAAEAGEGYSLVDGYHLPPVMFTAEEASAIFLGSKFVEQLTDESVKASAESALLKIKSVLPAETQQYLEQLGESTALFIARPGPANNGFRNDLLHEIQEAIVHSRVLFLEYFVGSRQSWSEREVEPMGLVYYAGHWHLIAYCRMRQDFRDFRTDRIRKLIDRDENFVPRPGFSVKRSLQQNPDNEKLIEVKAVISERVAGSVRDRHHHGLVEEEPTDNGVLMTFMTTDIKWMLPWLLGYGRTVTVLSPESLRRALREEAEKVFQRYR